MSNSRRGTVRSTKRTNAAGVTENVNEPDISDTPLETAIVALVQNAMLVGYLLTKLVRVATWSLVSLGLLTLLTLLNLSGVF